MAASATFISPPRPIVRRAAPTPASRARSATIILRLKLIADAGLVGLPNAGKSTLLASVSAARPKIADYPFTTLHPGLGVVNVDGKEFVLADIPGLIEGAHEGHGLGDRFLGHVERCGVLLHLIDATCEHAGKSYKIVRGELEAYGCALDEKPEIVALTKIDAVDADTLKQQVERLKRAIRSAGPELKDGEKPRALHKISAVSGEGVVDVLREVWKVVLGRRQEALALSPTPAWRP